MMEEKEGTMKEEEDTTAVWGFDKHFLQVYRRTGTEDTGEQAEMLKGGL